MFHIILCTLETELEVNSLSSGRYHGNSHPHAPATNDVSSQERYSKCDLVTGRSNIYAT